MLSINYTIKLIILLLIFFLSGAINTHAATTYTYDANGQLTKAAYADGRSINYKYDASGNIIEVRREVAGGGIWFNLSTFRIGKGQGTITSSDGLINCGTNCLTGYAVPTMVKLTAAAQPGSFFNGWSDDCSGRGECNLNVNANKKATASFSLVSKSLSVPIPAGQAGNINVATPTAGCGFASLDIKTEEEVANDPDHNYPFGVLSFTVNCAAVDVIITYPAGTDLTGFTYRKYGPTTPGVPSTTQWYDFTFPNVTIAGNTVTLHLKDGQLGDDTGVDGIIVDAGGPSIPAAVNTPALSEWAMLIFMLLAGVAAAYRLRRMQG